MNADTRARPVFVIKTGTMKQRDIRRLERMAFIVVVESDDPDAVRLLEPPLDADVSAQARAALSLFRSVVNMGHSSSSFTKADLITWFVQRIIEPTQPKPVQKVQKK